MRLIDAEVLRAAICESCMKHGRVCYARPDIDGYECSRVIAIDHAPTIDAVEVIRCRDCRYWDAIQKKPGKGICAPPSKAHGGYCIRRGATDDTDFCSKGERRENRGRTD